MISVRAHRTLGGYRRLRTRTWIGRTTRQWISAEWAVVGSADTQQTAMHALAAGCADRRQSEALGPKVKDSDARQIAASYPNSAGASAAERKVAQHSQAFRAPSLCAPFPAKLPHIKSLRTLFWFKPSSIMYTNQRIKQHYHA